jgi:hypothetical protein
MSTQESNYPYVLITLAVAGLVATVGLLMLALHGFKVFW